MTVDSSYSPDDACPASRDADIPTAFQEAAGLMSVPRWRQPFVANNKWFGKGWDAGIERDLGAEFYPTEDHVVPATPDNVREAQEAFALGLLAGLIAEVRQYPTPHCIYTAHDNGSKCDEAETDYTAADTHRDRYPSDGIARHHEAGTGHPSGPSGPSQEARDRADGAAFAREMGLVTDEVQPFKIDGDGQVVDNPAYADKYDGKA